MFAPGMTDVPANAAATLPLLSLRVGGSWRTRGFEGSRPGSLKSPRSATRRKTRKLRSPRTNGRLGCLWCFWALGVMEALAAFPLVKTRLDAFNHGESRRDRGQMRSLPLIPFKWYVFPLFSTAWSLLTKTFWTSSTRMVLLATLLIIASRMRTDPHDLPRRIHVLPDLTEKQRTHPEGDTQQGLHLTSAR